MNMKLFVTVGLLSACVLNAEVSNGVAPAAAAPAAMPTPRATKIALFEPQKVMGESEEYRDKMGELQAEFQKRVTDLQKQEMELKKKAQTATGAPSERELMKDLAKQQKDIEIEGNSLQREFGDRQQEMQMALAQKVDAAVEVVAKDKWDAVFPKFFYAAADINITDAVTKQLNQEYKKSKAAAKFKKETKEPAKEMPGVKAA